VRRSTIILWVLFLALRTVAPGLTRRWWLGCALVALHRPDGFGGVRRLEGRDFPTEDTVYQPRSPGGLFVQRFHALVYQLHDLDAVAAAGGAAGFVEEVEDFLVTGQLGERELGAGEPESQRVDEGIAL
jgi:hypothetical protein